MSPERIARVHPSEILLEEFLKPMGLSQNRLALNMRVPPRRVNEIVHGKRRITADTALRLGRYFGMCPQFWLGLQMDTTSTWKRTDWETGSPEKFGNTQPRADLSAPGTWTSCPK